MSIDATKWIISLRLPARDKVVLLILADAHNGTTGRCDPGLTRLSRDSGKNRRDVLATISRAEGWRLLKVRHGNRERSNSYILHIGAQLPDGIELQPRRGRQARMGGGSKLEPRVNPPLNHPDNPADPAIWNHPSSKLEPGVVPSVELEPEDNQKYQNSDASHLSAARSQAPAACGQRGFQSREEAIKVAADQRLPVIIKQDATTGFWGWDDQPEAAIPAQVTTAGPVDGMDVPAAGPEAPDAEPVTNPALVGLFSRRASADEQIQGIERNIAFMEELRPEGWQSAVSRMQAEIAELRSEARPAAGQGGWRDRTMQPSYRRRGTS